MSVAETTNCWS